MLKEHLPRVTYHQVYSYTNIILVYKSKGGKPEYTNNILVYKTKGGKPECRRLPESCCRTPPGSLADYPEVDMLGMWYQLVNFRAEKAANRNVADFPRVGVAERPRGRRKQLAAVRDFL